MSKALSPSALKGFFDANPTTYKTSAYGYSVLADGYLPSVILDYLLCTPYQMVANPVAVAPQIPAPFTAEQMLAAISASDAVKVVGGAMTTKLIESINAQDRPACQAWASLCLAAGFITSAEMTAILNIVNGTMADPSWSAQIPAPCDLAAEFVDGQGQARTRLEFALNADGSRMAVSGIAFINAALGRA